MQYKFHIYYSSPHIIQLNVEYVLVPCMLYYMVLRVQVKCVLVIRCIIYILVAHIIQLNVLYVVLYHSCIIS
jgi:hypothetical protein